MSIEAKDYLNNRKNLNSIAVNYIKDAMLSGIYKDGDRILETEVAVKLGVSRAPVREAIIELEKEGVLVSKPRKGTFVAEFSSDDIKEIFDIRLLLENDIYRIIINEDKLTEEDFMYLENLIKEMIDISESSMEHSEKSLLINSKNMYFHQFIWEKSSSKRRTKILEMMLFQIRIAISYDMQKTGDLRQSATDHWDIVKALKNKDIDSCIKASTQHIATYKKEHF